MKTTTLRTQYIINAKGKKTGVLLSLKRYEQLMEDLHDLAVVAERRKEEPISLDEGLELTKTFRKRLLRQKKAVAKGERGELLDDVVARLGLT